jgi:hyaluronan synthase
MRQQYDEDVNEKECHDLALRHCIQLARITLEQEKIKFGGVDGVRQICIQQKHMHKKGIMFTTYIFALVIADILGVEFLWSSDSDTLVLPDSIERTVNSIAADSSIGGASSGLIVHNETETAVTKLSATVYWGELYLTRSTPAATATSDCQSGPSTLFRLAALPGILVPWYLQTVMGKRMVSIFHHCPLHEN